MDERETQTLDEGRTEAFRSEERMAIGSKREACRQHTRTGEPEPLQANVGEYLRRYLTVVVGRCILKYMLDQTIDLDRTFQALADKSRRTIVERLTL